MKSRHELIRFLLPLVKFDVVKLIGKKTYSTIRHVRFSFERIASQSVIFIGDSLIDQWSTLEENFPKIIVLNRGISGDTSDSLRTRFFKHVDVERAKGLVILIGTNDVANGTDIELILENIKNVIANCIFYNKTIKIIVCQNLPRVEPSLCKKIELLNTKIINELEFKPNIIIVKTFGLYYDHEAQNIRKEFFTDGVHLNELGYAILTNAIACALRDAQL